MQDSLLFRRSLAFYDVKGADAWSDSIVPTQVTSNAYLAEAYAGFILEHLRDRTLDPSKPVYVVELGAGSGRLGHQVVQALARLARPNGPRVVYVLTDVIEKNIEGWLAHPQLAQLMQQGALDVARFDCDAPEPLRLLHSERTLDPTANPVVLISNYVLDSLAHALLQFDHGHVSEVWMRAGVHEGGAMALDLHPRRMTSRLFDDDVLNSIVEEYASSLSQSRVLIPVRAVSMLSWWCEQTGHNLVLLLADKMHRRVRDLDSCNMPYLAQHGEEGCISVTVNAHALTRWVRDNGGVVHHSRSEDQRFCLSVLAMGDGLHSVGHSFRTWLDDPGPVDIYRLSDALNHGEQMTAEQVVVLLRLCCFDDYTFMRTAGYLPELVMSAPAHLKRDLAMALRQVHKRAFRRGLYPDLCFRLARVHSALGTHADAHAMFLQSLREHGAFAATLFNLALTSQALGDMDQARRWNDEALRVDPAYANSLRWRQKAQDPATREE